VNRKRVAAVVVAVVATSLTAIGILTRPTQQSVHLPIVSLGSQPAPVGAQYAANRKTASVQAEFRAFGQWSYSRLDVQWNEIELEPGVYTWPVSLDQAVERMVDADMFPVLVLHSAPSWTLRFPEKRCSEPAEEYRDDWLSWVQAVAQRYDGVAAYEVWNEPDIPMAYVPAGWDELGCWNIGDPEGDGARYAGFAEATAQAIKAVKPSATVLAGSLALGCTITGQAGSGDACGALQFLDGMLDAGIPSADGLSYHAYEIFWPGVPASLRTHEWKYQRVLARTDLPLWVTEASYLCQSKYHGAEVCRGAEFEAKQAEYMTLLWPFCKGTEQKCIWYSFSYNGWEYADMQDRSGRMRAVYDEWIGLSLPVPVMKAYPGPVTNAELGSMGLDLTQD
jgi:hypothetical protein